MNELRRRKVSSGAITACVLVAIGAAIWLVINPSVTGCGGTHKDWLVHVTPENLVAHSQHIVLARYADEADYEIPDPSCDPADVESHTNGSVGLR